MNIQFLEPARAELIDAVSYYNRQRQVLGAEFANEVRVAIERIIEYPEAWPLVAKRTRRCRTKRFPYGIIYQIRGDTLIIIAVLHLRREPQSWKARIPKQQ
ncbi:MAG: type II toxin-antitoxin system RelE/ParE family toxin [Desulfomonilaceae bacterium]